MSASNYEQMIQLCASRFRLVPDAIMESQSSHDNNLTERYSVVDLKMLYISGSPVSPRKNSQHKLSI